MTGGRGVVHIKKIIYEHGLLSILFAAFLTILVLIALVSLNRPTEKNLEHIIVSEQNDIYDLTDIRNLEKTIIVLVPGEAYYPGIYLTPETINTAVSESTDLFEEIRADYLSQRFVLKVSESSEVYNMTFKLSGRHAIKVYVNGNPTAQIGQPGTTKKGTEVWENNITFHGTAINGEIDIIINSAQFYHSKRGASLGSISFSKAKTDSFFFDRINGIAISGALLCVAALLMGVYILLSRTKATLYFALACITMALRELLQSQAWIYFPIHGNISFMLEYLSVVLLTIFLTLYLAQYAEGKFLKVVRYTAIFGSFIYGTCVLFGDSLFYTSVLSYYQALLVLTIIPGISYLFRKMRRPTAEQAAAMYGIGVFFLAAVYDIVMYSDIFGDGPNIPVSEASMLVFALAQTVSLFRMNNRVLAEAKEAEQKLEAEKTALENLNRLKTEFLGNVSHELKTPLTVMSGYAQTTEQLAANLDVLDASEVSRRMTLISSEAERLSLMVNQILEVSRMEEGRMVMEPVCCYMDEIIHTTVGTHYPILNKNRNRLDIRIEGSLPAIYADPLRISQVIVNLISNAVRFTIDGIITITAKKQDDKILVCVSDTGVGITSAQYPYLFQRYGKKQKSGDGRDTGTGLGLYICKYIVEQHGGKIWIESKEHVGTTVCFTLPLA